MHFYTSKACVFVLLIFILLSIVDSDQNSVSYDMPKKLVRRNVGYKCSSTESCKFILPGSLCLNGVCACPQGYLPNSRERLTCFQSAKHLGDLCNVSLPCRNDLSCVNSTCHCPEGFQLFQVHGTYLCLLWHRPIRLVDQCRSNDDCRLFDQNSVCRNRWCQCRNGFQLFETMLFGLKHKCFKKHEKTCHTSSHCTKLTTSADQHCVCYHGNCYCIPYLNSSSLDTYPWDNEKPSFNQLWKKDIILATRLLFITIILFFIPCFVYVTRFVYVTLGVRSHSRGYFSHCSLPVRSARAEMRHSRNRSNSIRPHRRAVYVPSSHCVEIPLTSCTHMMADEVDVLQVQNPAQTGQASSGQASSNEAHKEEEEEEDPPPSYDEVMQLEQAQSNPPPPYREV